MATDKTVKAQAIDLGTLQRNLVKTASDLKRDQAAYERASVALDRARSAYQTAHQQLKDAARNVLA